MFSKKYCNACPFDCFPEKITPDSKPALSPASSSHRILLFKFSKYATPEKLESYIFS
jgi:hypothetical protein